MLKNYNKSTALIIAHKSSKNNKAYADLSKKLAKYFKNKNFNTEIILPFDIGLSFKDKFKNSLYVLRKLISIFCRFYFLKLSDFNFIIFTIYRKLYKDKLKKYFLNHNLNLIVCSYINFQYESVFIDAAKELGIKYFKYDYSLGYPIKDKTL